MNKPRAKNNLLSGEEIGLKLLQSACEMRAGLAARVTTPEGNAVTWARQRTGLTQAQFAGALHVSMRTLQEWERGRRAPSGAAQALIWIASKHPQILRESFEAAQSLHRSLK
ncbi:MAG: helix-turn-helix domain-containing protein [Pseudomonadota bacterium]